MRLLIILLIGFNSYGQTTAIPDAVFEQKLIELGYDTVIDGEVLTSNISGVTSLSFPMWCGVTDLTGIEDFSSLIYLDCNNNEIVTLDVSQNTELEYLNCFYTSISSIDVTQNIALLELRIGGYSNLSSLDVSQNTALTHLGCDGNTLTSLDLSQNTALAYLSCVYNSLTSLDLSQNIALTILKCLNNQLTSLDLSQNSALTNLWCYDNKLTSLDLSQNTSLTDLRCNNNELICLNVKNGNNINVSSIESSSNPNLTCIEVDDVNWSTTNWTDIDAQTTFSLDCPCWGVSIKELSSTPKQLLKIVDFMGRETNYKPNTALIYIYDDGSRERVFKTN